MTNKKFKVAAMSMALTACVAAQPLIANAADDVNAVSNEPAPQSEGESTASAPVAAASVSSDPETNKQDEGAVDVIGDPDISVDYDHDKDKVTKDDSSTTTESTGPVNRDVPKESEPGAQQPSGDGQQDGNHETDLNNEQEGPKDGGSETEKKPIGEAEKTETETKDTELVLGKPNTTTTTTTNPDGSTTTTTTTTTDAALETTTKVEGEASAKTEEDSSEDVKKNLKEELQGGELSWDTETKTKFGDYTVTDAVVKDGKKEFTLTKEDKIETGEMTGLDISKLIEAGYKDNGDGTYTLTKEYTDSQGQKQTTTVKVDSSTATKTTRTTLTVTMEKTPHHDSKDVDESTDTGNSQLENRYPAQSVIKDFGNYDVSYEQSFAWDDSGTESSKPRGTGSDSFFSFKKLFNHITRGSTDVSRKQGTITANYATTSDAKVTDASKKTCVKTDSSVKYHYSYVERQELDPITETKTVTTPADDDGDDDDGGDKIIEEKDHDSPVLPGTPELPPVQDAKPDAPVPPADPALPAVQDAHALPQTGVNWLAAIGLALSGMTLMITGAFASLTGKNAKH